MDNKQNRLILIATLLISMAFPLRAENNVERVLTLKESIALGISNNHQLLLLKERIALSQQHVIEARSSNYPKIDFNMNVLRIDNSRPSILAPSFGAVYLPAGVKDQYYLTRFSLYQQLYAGGRFSTTQRVAEANLSQSKSEADIAKNDVVRTVKKSFTACLAARERATAYREALAGVQLQKTPLPVFAGELPFEDKITLDLMEAEHRLETARLSFVQSLGIEQNTLIEINGILQPPATEEYDLNKCLARASQYRPELRQTRFQETIDALRVSLSLTERFPTVTLGADYEWTGDTFPLPEKNWAATINLNMPLFDGWASWARIKQRRIQAREGKIRQAELEDAIISQVRQAYVEYHFWKKRFGIVAELSAAPGDINKRLATRLEYINTVEQLLASHADLEWAIGQVLSDNP